jgi:hypothetical protein
MADPLLTDKVTALLSDRKVQRWFLDHCRSGGGSSLLRSAFGASGRGSRRLACSPSGLGSV